MRKYFTLQCIHLCVWHKTEITLGWCPLKMLFCCILFFSVLSWFTNDESWSPKWKPLLYNNAGKRKTTFSHPLQLKFQVFPVLQTQCPRVAFAILLPSMPWKCLVFLGNASRGLVTSTGAFHWYYEGEKKGYQFLLVKFVSGIEWFWDPQHSWLYKHK